MYSRIRNIIVVCLIMLAGASTSVQSAESSILFLPGHIKAEDGQVSLFADYGSIGTNGRVPVYLVNQSTEPLMLNTQDGDIYLKLEFKDESGRWIRAQPHAYSWCGNSYMYRPVVRPGHYVLTSGYQPINGVSRTIRYRLHSQAIELSSNIGIGVVADADIERASRDAMSVKEGDFDFVSRIALSEAPVENNMDHIRDLRSSAIWQLGSGRFDAEKSMEVLLVVRDTNPELEQSANYALQKLGKPSGARIEN